jgi:oligosaccharide repeat unit polymerase
VDHFGLIKRFHLVWLIYWFVYLLQPVHSAYPEIRKAWSLQLLFVISVSIAYFVGLSLITADNKSHSDNKKKFDPTEVEEIIRWGLWISLLGFCLLFIDKIYVQKIDFSQGLAFARTQWQLRVEQRNGTASSPFSVLGYLFGGAFFLSLSLTLSKHVFLSEAKRVTYFILGFILLMINSIAIGGRSLLLLAIPLISFGYFSLKRGKLPQLWRNRRINRVFQITGILGTSYILFVFYSRAVASNLNIVAYSQGFMDYLGLVPKPWFSELVASSRIGSILALLNLAISYLTHSLSTFAAIVEHGRDSGDGIFALWLAIGSKLGIFGTPTKCFLAGRLPSLPGELYAKWGLLGLMLGAGALGLIAGVSCNFFARRRSTVIVFFACATIECVLLLSPFLFAGDILFFPSMVVGGLIAIRTGRRAAYRQNKIGAHSKRKY